MVLAAFLKSYQSTNKPKIVAFNFLLEMVVVRINGLNILMKKNFMRLSELGQKI